MNIVLCYPLESQHLAAIQAVAPDANLIDAGQERIAEAIHDADIFCGHAKVPLDWEGVVARGRLRWIQSSAAGIDHCLVPAVARSPIPVTSSSGLFAVQVAEHTMALLLALIRSIPTFVGAQQTRSFVRLPTDDLAGKTIGIVGLGGNGRQIAHVLAPFDVRILATDWFPMDPPPHVDALWGPDQLDRLLGEADVVVLTVPLTETTTGMIDGGAIGKMKQGAMLINVARGPVVQEEALVAALNSGRIAAAGLDVTETEPLLRDSPLWECPNVLITPHVGAQSAKRLDRTTGLFCENLRRFLRGEALLNLVDKQLGFPHPETRPAPGTYDAL